MKRIAYIFMTLGLFLTSSYSAEARNDVEGLWSNQRYNVKIRVEQTRDGIRVQRTDRSRWRAYEQVRNLQFRDREGNTYYMVNDQELEWESRDGRKRIRFRRDRRRSTNRPQTIARRAITARDLHGTWLNPWNSDCLIIRARRGELRVRGIGIGTRTFFVTRNGFQDRKGNILRLQRNRLQLINRRGRLVGHYVR